MYLIYIAFVNIFLDHSFVRCSNVTDVNELLTSTELNPDVSTDDYSSKDKTFQTCLKFVLDPDEYVLLPNRTVYIEAYNKSYTEEFYVLYKGSLTICVPLEFFEIPSPEVALPLMTLTSIGIGISIICLLMHLFIFMFIPNQRNLPGYNLASLCLSLLLGYTAMLIKNEVDMSDSNTACVASAVLMQFFFLASFVWMFIMSFDVFKTILNATGNLRVSNKEFKAKKYIFNSLVAWGVPSAFTASALIVDNVDLISDSYRPYFGTSCWFKHKLSLLMFFAGPVFTIVCINFILFGMSAYSIFINRIKRTKDSSASTLTRTRHFVYFRLSVIMGTTWITGTLAPLVEVLWLWYLFAILNTLQGFFIFIAFTCSSKVRRSFKYKVFGSTRRSSDQHLTPTFQSYCYYANSIEKDLDKVVDSKGKSEIDTIVIHL